MADNNEFYRLDLVLGMQDKLTSQLEKVDSKVKKVEENVRRTEKAFSHLGNARAEPKVTADTGIAERQFDRIEKRLQALDKKIGKPKIDAEDKTRGKTMQVENRLRSLTSKAWKVTLTIKDGVSNKLAGLKNSLTSPIGMMGMGAATMGVGGFLVDSAQKAMDFSYQISNIKALTNMGDAQLEQVRKKALDLGAATQFSSTEAAQGMTELLKAGMSVEEVMNGATDAALNLAAAGELSLPEAAEIMSTAMNAFKVTDAAHAADILAGAANASATDVHELKYALAAVSSVAAGVGMSFDDTNTALAVFAQNGLKGSDAGTSLKTMLMRLEPTTKSQMDAFQQLGLITEQGTSAFYDAEGHMKSLADIAGLLHDRMKDLNPEQQQALLNDMFGSDAIRGGMILLKEGADGVRKMQEEMTKYTASDVAKTKWENAKGDIVRLQSAFQNFQITALAPLEPAIGKVAKALTDFFGANAEGAANTMAGVSQKISDFIDSLAGDGKFQAMDWGDKIVYVLDKMMDAISDWADGPGGAQFGKVMTKLAEIGMRAFLAAIIGLFKGSLSALFSGNFVGALGLAAGGMMLGGGTLLGGLFKGAKALGGLAIGGGKGAGIYKEAKALASESGRGAIMSRLDAAKFVLDMGPLGKAADFAKSSPIVKSLGGLLGKAIKPLAAIGDVADFATSDNKAKTGGAIAGHWAGMVAGGKLGAAAGAGIGSLFGGVGAAPGAAIGGVLGSIAGFFGGDKLGAAIGDTLGKIDFSGAKEKLSGLFDFSGMGERVSEGLSAAEDAIGGFFDSLPERAGYAIGYIIETVSQMPSEVSQFFLELVEEASTYVSELPGRIASWLLETAASAGATASEIITAVMQWFEQLPGLVSTKMAEMASAVTSWCSNIISGISSWFSQIPSIIGGYFDSAISTIRSKASSAWSYVKGVGAGISSRFSIGYGAGAAAAQSANGGVINSPLLTWVAEAGYPEVIIPTDPAKRARGLSLWQEAGDLLGVQPSTDAGKPIPSGGASFTQQIAEFVNGSNLFSGVSNLRPAFAGAGAGSDTGSAGSESRSGDSYTFSGVSVQIGSNLNEEEMALAIGRRFLSEIKQSFQNRG